MPSIDMDHSPLEQEETPLNQDQDTPPPCIQKWTFVRAATLVLAAVGAVGTVVAVQPKGGFLQAAPADISSKAAAPQGVAAQAFLDAHNQIRCMHGEPLLKWSVDLANHAQSWAEAAGSAMGHSTAGSSYRTTGDGENAAWGNGGDAQKAVNMWYEEIQNTNGGHVYQFGYNTGHYSQLVWKGTTEVGCGRMVGGGAPYGAAVYCQYRPGGNMYGAFVANVLPPVKEKDDCPSLTSGPPVPSDDGSSMPNSAVAKAGVSKTGAKTAGCTCTNACGKHGQIYNWCDSDCKGYNWDYCTPGAATSPGCTCTNACGPHGYSYDWCDSHNCHGYDWDYCS